jgi:tetratricopeptide (TPR) repeat protein
MIGFFLRVLSILPSIRRPLQLIGLALTIVAALIVQLVSPNNVAAMMSAGTVGVGLIVFSTLLLIVPLLPRAQRALFIIGMFLIYVAASVYLVHLTYSFISSGARQITEDGYRAISAKLTQRATQLARDADRLGEEVRQKQIDAEKSSSLIEKEEIDQQISKMRSELQSRQTELAGVRSRLQELANTGRLVSNILVELERLRSAAREEDTPALGEIRRAEADASRGDLDSAEKVLNAQLAQQKKNQARTVFLLGQVAELKGEISKAKELYATAHRELPSDPIVAEYNARVSRLVGNFSDAIATYQRAVDLSGRHSSGQKQWLLINYAVALWHAGEYEKARNLFTETYQASHQQTLLRALAAENYGSFLWDRTELADAEAKLREAVRTYSYLEPGEQFLKYEAYNDLGGVLIARGKYEESLTYLKSALDLMGKNIGAASLPYAQTLTNVIGNRSRYGDLVTAKPFVGLLVSANDSGGFFGYEHGAILSTMAEYFIEGGAYLEAKDMLMRAIRELSRGGIGGVSESLLARTRLKLSELELDQGHADLAERELVENRDLIGRVIASESRNSAHHDRVVGRIALAQKRWAEAIPYLERSTRTVATKLGNEHPTLVWSLIPLTHARFSLEEISKGEASLVAAEGITTKWLHPSSRAVQELQALRVRRSQLGKGGA